jgi:hypothetical protein
MLFASHDSSTWTIETRLLDPTRGASSHVRHSERVRDKVLTHVQFDAQECGLGEVELIAVDEVGRRLGPLRIPVSAGPDPQGARHYVVPEYRLRTKEPEVSGRWIRWEIQTIDSPIVDLAVYDSQQTLVRSWPSHMLQAGHTTLLWDGRDASNALVPPGEYSLQVGGVVLDAVTVEPAGQLE